MQRLTAMTIGSLMLGLAGFAYDASAQTPAAAKACASHEAVVYFAPDSTALNAYSDYAIERMADAARACGAPGVVIQASSDRDRTFAVASALSTRGVKPVIVPSFGLMPAGDTMIARSVTLRVATDGNVAS